MLLEKKLLAVGIGNSFISPLRERVTFFNNFLYEES